MAVHAEELQNLQFLFLVVEFGFNFLLPGYAQFIDEILL